MVVGALLLSTLLRTFVGQMFIIPSESMEHTLEIGDRVAVSKLNAVHRGEVVVFVDPGGWLPTSEVGPNVAERALQFIGIPVDAPTDHLIKRVIGMPGDHVVCCDTEHRVTVNGYPLDETSYLYDEDGRPVRPSDTRFDVVVPADRLWVMGDHRNLSGDSRCHLADLTLDGVPGSAAFVPVDDVVGPAVAIVSPLARAKLLHVPETFDQVPAPTGSPPAEPVFDQRFVTC